MENDYELDLDPNAVCRICLSSATHLSNVFASSIVDGYVIALPEMIVDCLNIRVSPTDGLPNKICAECKTNTTSFYSFKSMSKRVASVLVTAMAKITLDLPDSVQDNPNLNEITEDTIVNEAVDDEMIYKPDETDFFVEEIQPEISSCVAENELKTDNVGNPGDISSNEECLMTEDATEATTFLSSDHMADENFENGALFEALQDDTIDNVDEQSISSMYNATSMGNETAVSQDGESNEQMSVLKRNVHTCPFCRQYFQNENDLNKHMSYHVDDHDSDVSLSYLIQYDNKSIYKRQPAQTKLNEKKTAARRSSAYICEICGKSFKVVAEYNHHKRVHVALNIVAQYMSTFICFLCNRGMESQLALDNHVCRPFQRPECEEDVSCEDYQFLDDERHIRCNLCLAIFSNEPNFREHMLLTHLKQYDCPFEGCGCSYSQLVHLSQHISSKHHTEKGLVCSHCKDGTVFPDKGELKRHYKECPAKKVNCTHCDKRFFTYTALSLHMSTTGKKHICGDCGKAFAQVGELKIHSRIHRNEKPFVCRVCSNSYRTASMRTAHMETHISGKTFKCEVCQKMFQSKGSWRNHVRRHRDNNKFECDFCERQFSTSYAMNVHKKKVHYRSLPDTEAIQSIITLPDSATSMDEPFFYVVDMLNG